MPKPMFGWRIHSAAADSSERAAPKLGVLSGERANWPPVKSGGTRISVPHLCGARSFHSAANITLLISPKVPHRVEMGRRSASGSGLW
jgi:hypothetical protein